MIKVQDDVQALSKIEVSAGRRVFILDTSLRQGAGAVVGKDVVVIELPWIVYVRYGQKWRDLQVGTFAIVRDTAAEGWPLYATYRRNGERRRFPYHQIEAISEGKAYRAKRVGTGT